jgi:hypothetical protein
MSLEERGITGIKTGLAITLLGFIRFLMSADLDSTVAWHCMLYRDFECDMLMPTFSPVLMQIGCACGLMGFMIFLFGGWLRRREYR